MSFEVRSRHLQRFSKSVHTPRPPTPPHFLLTIQGFSKDEVTYRRGVGDGVLAGVVNLSHLSALPLFPRDRKFQTTVCKFLKN